MNSTITKPTVGALHFFHLVDDRHPDHCGEGGPLPGTALAARLSCSSGSASRSRSGPTGPSRTRASTATITPCSRCSTRARATTQGTIADALGYDRGQLVGLSTSSRRGRLPRAAPRSRRPAPPSRQRDPRRQEALARLREILRQVEDEFLAPLEERERKQFHALMLRLAEHHLPHCSPIGKPTV